MNNKTVIDIITNLCIKKENPNLYEMDHVYTAMVHGYYFVKPGKATDRFTDALMFALAKGVVVGTNDFKRTQGLYPIEACTWEAVAKRVLKVLRRFFDREYFQGQIAALYNDELNDETLLTKYLGMFDQNLLFEFVKGVEHFSMLYNLLQESDASYINVIFTERCHEIDSSIPSMCDDVRKWCEFVKETPRFMFNCLEEAEIAKIIDEFVTHDRVFAGNFARALYHTRDYNCSMLYSIIAYTFERMCGANPYGV